MFDTQILMHIIYSVLNVFIGFSKNSIVDNNERFRSIFFEMNCNKFLTEYEIGFYSKPKRFGDKCEVSYKCCDCE